MALSAFPAGRAVFIIDDGISTGATARAACRVAQAQGATQLVLTVPVCAPTAVTTLAADADEVVLLRGRWSSRGRPRFGSSLPPARRSRNGTGPEVTARTG